MAANPYPPLDPGPYNGRSDALPWSAEVALETIRVAQMNVPRGETGRKLAVAATHLETALLWLRSIEQDIEVLTYWPNDGGVPLLFVHLDGSEIEHPVVLDVAA